MRSLGESFAATRWVLVFYIHVLLLLVSGTSGVTYASELPRSATFSAVNNIAPQNWKQALKTGHILLTDSPKPTNFLILAMYPEFSPFFHVGIIEVEGDNIFVYEANGEINKLSAMAGLAGGSAPSDSIIGHVKKTPLDVFLSESRTISIFSPPPQADIQALVNFSDYHAKSRTPFDAYFDAADSTRLYCSEFVSLALRTAGVKGNFLVKMRNNPSLQKVRNWMKVPDNSIIPGYKLVSPGSWVGTVSLDYSELELQVDRAIKLELYQRFSANQKVGNVVNFGGDDDFVKEIKQFRQIAFALFEKQKGRISVDEVVRKVRSAADSILGTMNDRYRMPYSRCSINLKNC